MDYLRAGRYRLGLDRPLIMGIVNVTPDSFYDGGRHRRVSDAVTHAEYLVREGADILDIGGESSRPGSVPISIIEEKERVLPVIRAASQFNIPLCVDTYKPEIMEDAIDAGAVMINDITGFNSEVGAQIVAKSDVAACVMHMKGSPKNMQSEPIYTNVVDEVKKFLISRISVLQALGVRKDKIIVDPGIGFGKSFEHNIAIIKDLGKFAELECPLLIGLSRKSWLKGIIDRPAENRLHGSVAAALIAVQKGVNILRVHDVGATRDALLVQDKLLAEDD